MFLDRPLDYIGSKHTTVTPAEYAAPVQGYRRRASRADTIVVVASIVALACLCGMAVVGWL